MTLQSGQMLAHYRLVEMIGEGGMGVVWKAEDTKLGRAVALKLLPAALAADPERLARFEREARVLASLSHPDIAGIHSFEHAEPHHFLVMELVSGEDLHQRLARGALPPEEALSIARHVASALETAHERGIVHRDLKPANIKITGAGEARVLDFGLAKAMASDESRSIAGNPSLTPTMTTPVTRDGVIMGTPCYMSPEQAKGRPTDRRADIWSFGCILYEMLTGRRLFQGDTVSEQLAAVLRDEVELASLPPSTPAGVLRLVGRCLDRDPLTRLQSIGEARIVLEAAISGKDPAPGLDAPASRTSGLRWAPALLGLVMLIAGFAAGLLSPWRTSSGGPPFDPQHRTFIEPIPERAIGEPPRDTPARQAISPDGKWIAWTAGERLWLRRLSELRARVVPGSEGARGVIWSPRSDAVAFSAGDRLLKFPVNGAEPVPLCRFAGGDFSGGSWSAERGIVFTLSRANWNGEILRVPEEGGEPEPFEAAPLAAVERRLFQPHFLPDGRSILYTVVTQESNLGEIALESNGRRVLLGLGDGSCQPIWSPTGHILYTRNSGLDSALWALPFSLERLAATGEPFRIIESASGASAASEGTLLYEVRHPEPEQLAWVDRQGRTLSLIGEPLPANIWMPSISRDGRSVAATIDWQRVTVWDLDRGVHTGITSDSEAGIFSAWLPGDEEIAYMHLGKDGALVARRADGSGEARVLVGRQGAAGPAFSADGSWMSFYVVDLETQRDLWAAPMDRLDEPFVVLRTPANEAMPAISPDGTLLAYQSDASGRWEIYVQPFPEGKGRWQVSSGGGLHPKWNPRGGEIFFVSGESLMVATITTRPEVRVGAPRRLFTEEEAGTRLSLPRHVENFYDVAEDGESFVVVRGAHRGTSQLVLAEGVLSK